MKKEEIITFSQQKIQSRKKITQNNCFQHW